MVASRYLQKGDGDEATRDGLSNQIAVDEIRAGISPLDPRGTWALGMVGASITAAHPGGPNHSEYGDGLTFAV